VVAVQNHTSKLSRQFKALIQSWLFPHYKAQAADAATCDLVALNEFLALMDGTPVRRSNDQ